MHEAIGFTDRASGRVARTDDVFLIFSITKALTAAAVLMRVDRGELSLTTRSPTSSPSSDARENNASTIAQMMCHTAGLSAGVPPIPFEMIGDQKTMVAAICQMGVEGYRAKKSTTVRWSRTHSWPKSYAALTAAHARSARSLPPTCLDRSG